MNKVTLQLIYSGVILGGGIYAMIKLLEYLGYDDDYDEDDY